MNHSFNVKVAEEFGIEKAILLENFYFWIIKNRANNKNLHNGKYYTYNTAEAFEKLFPYMKARKIAQLLREMEHEDGLLISGQFNNYDRTKSYTLTDLAMSYFEVAIIQKFDNGRYKNATMENQKSVSCLNTDINTDVETYSCSTQQQFRKPTIKEIQDYCSERGNKINAEYFFDYYEAKGWIVGKGKMKDWKAVVRVWEKKNPAEAPKEKDKEYNMVCEVCGKVFDWSNDWECPKCHSKKIVIGEKKAG
jgi:hypothetical protein